MKEIDNFKSSDRVLALFTRASYDEPTDSIKKMTDQLRKTTSMKYLFVLMAGNNLQVNSDYSKLMENDDKLINLDDSESLLNRFSGVNVTLA